MFVTIRCIRARSSLTLLLEVILPEYVQVRTCGGRQVSVRSGEPSLISVMAMGLLEIEILLSGKYNQGRTA